MKILNMRQGRWSAILLLLITSITSITSPIGYTEEPKMSATPYSTVLDAICAAANQYNPASIVKNIEHYGVILKRTSLQEGRDPQYFYTHESARYKHDKFRLKLRYTKEYRPVAIWHTHGRRHKLNKLFSPTDIDAANLTRLPVYLADFTGMLKVYFPDETVTQGSKSNNRNYLRKAKRPSIGSVVRDNQQQIVRIRTDLRS